MASVDIKGCFKFKGIAELAESFPDLSGGLLGFIGKKARTRLKMQYLSGQEIDLRKFPVDSKGKYTIVSDVNKKRTFVKIWSYPVNLFEKGRTLRDGTREAPKNIIEGKLKRDIMSGLSGYAGEFETKILDREFKKI